jgi:hypothetical protein
MRRRPPVSPIIDPEIEANRRDIEGMKPIVEEAVRRTDARFVAVEEATAQTRLALALIRDIERGIDGT